MQGQTCVPGNNISNQSQTIRQSLAQMENIYIYISKNIYAQDGWISKSLPCLVERMVTRVKTNSSSCWKRQDQHQTAVSTTGNYFIFSWWGQPTDTACSVLVELLLVENTEASNKSRGEEIKEERHEPEHSAWGAQQCFHPRGLCGSIALPHLVTHCSSSENCQCFLRALSGEIITSAFPAPPEARRRPCTPSNRWITLLTSGFGAACW